MHFASPWFFLALLFVAWRFIVGLRERLAPHSAFVFSSFLLLPRKRTIRTTFSWLPLVLETAGLTLLVFALARPQHVTYEAAERFGIDLVVALDASGSMAAEDFLPRNRFSVAQELIAEFIQKRENDRIGLVTFGSRAATRVPITFDRDVVQKILEKTAIGQNGDGTAIGQAIATAVNRLRNSRASTRVILLVTDVVNNAGSVDPRTAAAVAAQLKMKIYAIGVGSKGPVPIPLKVQDQFTGEIRTEYQWIRGEIDEPMLKEITARSGGAYFRAVDRKTLEGVLARIDELEKSRLSAPPRTNVDELFLAPLAWGIALLAVAYLSGESIWMRLPA